RRPLRRVPRRAVPSGAGRARGRVLHAGRVERRAPAALVVTRELQIEALARHADRYASDGGSGVESTVELGGTRIMLGAGSSVLESRGPGDRRDWQASLG